MTTKSAPYYWIECDVCGEKSTADGDYAAWGDHGSAVDEATDRQWALDLDGKDYCDDCAPFPYCAGCGERTARTEYDGDMWCDECIQDEAVTSVVVAVTP